MMANSKRKCKQCGEYVRYFVVTPKGVFCNIDSAVKWSYANKSKGAEVVRKAQAKKTRIDKLKVKPKTKWLSELQSLVNKYIRLRDAGQGCISCDKSKDWQGQWHAGHYYSRGHSSSLRFNLWNIHKQCSVCNNHLSGNIGQYTPKLIDKIGVDNFNYLTEHKSDIASYDIEYIKRAIAIVKRKLQQ